MNGTHCFVGLNTIVHVDQDLVLDFKAWLHTKTGQKIQIQSKPDIIEFKYDFSKENYRKLIFINNSKLTRGKKKKEQELILKKVYNNPIPVTKIKYNT